VFEPLPVSAAIADLPGSNPVVTEPLPSEQLALWCGRG